MDRVWIVRNYSLETEPTDLVGPWLEPILQEVQEFRRDLHAHPELSFQEFRTSAKIHEHLVSAGLKPQLLEGTGVVVDIGEGPIATALRGDIDALPILEETGLPFASRNHGVTHGCGHDFHTAAMLGIALVLSAMHAQTPLGGTIRIIFQPAEETLPGGALSCIGQGVLDGVPRIMALHCDPRIEVGKIGTRIGPITSASDTIKIELSGRGGHSSRPHLTEDLVFALAQIAINVPAVLSRRVDVRSGVSMVWGQISAGSAPNAIPSSGAMSGTMRCLDREAWHSAGELLDEVVKQVAAPYGVDVHLEHIRGVPPVVNSEHETALIEAAARAELGEDSVVLAPQSMGGEDFAWFLQGIPGSLMRLGTHVPGGAEYDLHRGDFIVDERALAVGIKVLCAAALRSLRVPSE